jgi:hypothetical protein
MKEQTRQECMDMVGYIVKSQILGIASAYKGSKTLFVFTEVGTPNIFYQVHKNGLSVFQSREYVDAVDKYLEISL